MLRRAVLCLLLVPTLVHADAIPPPAAKKPARAEMEKLLGDTDKIAKTVSSMRGLALKQPLSRGIMSRDEVLKRLIALIDEEYAPGELEAESRAYKRLGLLPRDTDLRQLFLDLLVEQIAGFYDPSAKQLYLADWIDASMQKVVIAHEVVHALQDQHFDLDKYVKLPKQQSDAILARKAIVEGDGVALMVEYAVAELNPKMDPWADDRLLDMMAGMTSSMPGQAVFQRSPLVLKETLVFPYEAGLRFVARIRKTRPWKEVDGAFRKPPLSTEQIIHPEKYEAGEKPVPVKMAAAPSLKGWKRIYHGDLGELGWSVLLREHGIEKDRAARAAAGWGGDELAVFAPANDPGDVDALVAVVASAWDQEMDAIEAFDALVDSVARLAGAANALPMKGAGIVAIRHESGAMTTVERRGKKLLILVGAPEALSPKLAKELWAKWK